MTRSIVLMMNLSLDGFLEGPNREIDWHAISEELHADFNAYIATASLMLSGRVTHELMASFWPTADQDPANSGATAEYAGIWRDMPKYVYSRTLKPGPTDWNTTVVPEVVPDEVRALKEQPGGDILLGGADLAATFLRHDLVDEFRIYIQPIVLGRGKRLFAESDAKTALTLSGTRTFGNGVVLLKYRR
jgi:dihydrofolate reductase